MKRDIKDIMDAMNGNKSTEDQKERIQDSYNSYKDMSQQDMMAKLVGNIKSQKEQGVFDEAMLDNLIKNSSGLLNKEQVDNMKNLVDQLKKI